jgi:hypothetical protein
MGGRNPAQFVTENGPRFHPGQHSKTFLHQFKSIPPSHAVKVQSPRCAVRDAARRPTSRCGADCIGGQAAFWGTEDAGRVRAPQRGCKAPKRSEAPRLAQRFSEKHPKSSRQVFSDLGIYHCGGVAQPAPTLSCFGFLERSAAKVSEHDWHHKTDHSFEGRIVWNSASTSPARYPAPMGR